MLDPAIHQRTRLRIMTLLFRNRQAAYTAVRDALGLTDGNLASHAARLEEAGYLDQRRVLLGREGFELRYFLTAAGEQAFRAYLGDLRELLREAEGGSGRGQGRAAKERGTGSRPDPDPDDPAAA